MGPDIRSLARDKYLTFEEVMRLRKETEKMALLEAKDHKSTWPRIWGFISLATVVGARVSELASIRLKDVDLKGKPPGLWLQRAKRRDGKDAPRDFVAIPDGKQTPSVKNLREFIANKMQWGDPVSPSSYLFGNKRGVKPDLRTLQSHFKRAMRNAGIPIEVNGKVRGVHCLRHTVGTLLFSQTKSLRIVQEQLGHRNIQNTAIYATVTAEVASKAINGLFNPKVQDKD